eukprot:TRINITY_DN31792_c0_g1_i1.p1 TRINITY_DN31792_c0_g1~~TRINITY_DN31792_c0_g1_i1.p1  ORF type:complete len:596 (-),score=89.23 TRINITY_DN31792_c0_g1_i1:114-1724(-)
MEGGGFRAFASDTGMIAGLLAVVGRRHNISHPSLASTGLLDRYQLLSSVSGSSWFLSELVFSNRFLTLVETLAASPRSAAKEFGQEWTSRWLVATQVKATKFDLLDVLGRLVIKTLLGTGDEDTLYLVKYFLATGFTWDHFVDVLLNSTADLGQEVLLGNAPTGWSAEKVWLVDHSVFLPSKGKVARIVQSKLGLPEVSYSVDGMSEPPEFLPAKFSIRLGDGPDASAPLPYCSRSAAEGLPGLRYVGRCLLGERTSTSGILGDDLANGSISRYAGRLPVARVAAASSAFVGSIIADGPLLQEFQALIGADVAPWVSAAAGGQAFKAAQELVGRLQHGIFQSSVDQLSSIAVHAVIDGGFTEGTGLAQAVASGAEDVLVVLNSYSVNDPTYLEILFSGGPPPPNPGVPPELFPVFQEPLASNVRAFFEDFHRLQIARDSSFLKVLAVGNFTASTAENHYFGIPAGREVAITVINVCSELGIGQFENMAHYSKLVQEVALTIIDSNNAEFVENVLLSKILAPAARHRTPGTLTNYIV